MCLSDHPVKKTSYWLGGFLLVVGMIWFLNKAGVIPGMVWDYFWPVVIIVAGLYTLVRGGCCCWKKPEVPPDCNGCCGGDHQETV